MMMNQTFLNGFFIAVFAILLVICVVAFGPGTLFGASLGVLLMVILLDTLDRHRG